MDANLNEVGKVPNTLLFETHPLPLVHRLGTKHLGIEGD